MAQTHNPIPVTVLTGFLGSGTKGVDIFRMKGILNFAGAANRYVFQGVHMLLNAEPAGAWKADETRKSQLVFIGRNLDRAELQEGFRACLG